MKIDIPYNNKMLNEYIMMKKTMFLARKRHLVGSIVGNGAQFLVSYNYSF
jgi:hypothetical protein